MNFKLFIALLFASNLLTATTRADILASADVPLLSDLQTTRNEMQQGCRPLLLEFASEYCEYCSLLEEHILKPIRRNRDYDSRVVMRKLLLGDAKVIEDFSGKPSNADKFGAEYDIRVTPTLIFVDQRAKNSPRAWWESPRWIFMAVIWIRHWIMPGCSLRSRATACSE